MKMGIRRMQDKGMEGPDLPLARYVFSAVFIYELAGFQGLNFEV